MALGDIFDGLESDFRQLANKSHMKFRIRATKLTVLSDRMMLRRILQNILSNAMRYTRQGGVLVGARMRKGRVMIEIADTGIGIPPDQLKSVFEEFHRGPEAATHHSGGLGLGLSIVQRMAQALDHGISVRSRVDAGTIFRLVVPLTPSGSFHAGHVGESRIDTPVFGLANANVLLVENDQTVLEATRVLLQRWGCNVRTASSLGEAVMALSGTGFEPGIIVADQHLNRSTLGTDTIAEIRRTVGWPVPAIIVTADANAELVTKVQAGKIELMHKPVRPAQLRALMAHLLS